MLTGDLVLAQFRKGKVTPGYLMDKEIRDLLPVVENLIKTVKNNVGSKRATLMDELKSQSNHYGKQAIKVKGLSKLLLDRCEFNIESEIDPKDIRQTVFTIASEERIQLSGKEPFNRDKVIKKASKHFDLDPDIIESLLYADLPNEQILNHFDSISSIDLFHRYNLALAQAVLYKATKVTIQINKQSPGDYRRLFRYIKFFRLIHHISGTIKKGYTIHLDGPFSLFESVQKYGFQLALFLPVLLTLSHWTFKAELKWGKAKQEATFELSPEDNLQSHYKEVPMLYLSEVEQFKMQFMDQPRFWDLSDNIKIIDLKGIGICIPDFVFTHKETGFKVYMEVFGYWSRALVWKRIEMLEKNFPTPLLLVLSKKLRVSEEVLSEEAPASILVYKSMIQVKEVLKRLDQLKP